MDIKFFQKIISSFEHSGCDYTADDVIAEFVTDNQENYLFSFMGGVISNLQTLVRCKTISYNDRAMEDDGEFRKLIDALPGLYPKVFAVCSFMELPDRALLFRWPGKSDKNPAVMMAHFQPPPSFFMAMKVAMHGKYRRMKTI